MDKKKKTAPKSKPRRKKLSSTWTLVTAVGSGLAFLVILLIIAIYIPYPTKFQIFVFRVVLALAAAAFGSVIPGFLKLKLPISKKALISAGGALALFVIVYSLNPPALIKEDVQKVELLKVMQSLSGVILDEKGEPIAGVLVKMEEYDPQAVTDKNGKFSFKLEVEKEETVRLIVNKEGYKTFRQDASMGNRRLTLRMEKVEWTVPLSK